MMKRIVRELTGTTLVPSCPLCGHDYGPDGGFRWRFSVEPRLAGTLVDPEGGAVGIGFACCPRCSLVHQRSFVPADEMKRIYSGPMYSKIVKQRADKSMRSAVYNEGWRAYDLCKVDGGGVIPSFVPDATRILDVGCAKLILMQSMDYFYGADETDGVDPNVTSKLIGGTIGFQVWDDIDAIPEGTQYDLITHVHTLEHIHDLQGHLAKVRELLTPDGTLFVMVPNMYSASALNFFHIYGFTTKTLRWLLESCGFEVLHTETAPACWMRWFPQDIICVAKLGEYQAPNYKPSRLLGHRKTFMNWLYLKLVSLPEWIRTPTVPRLVVPIYIKSKEDLAEYFPK